MGNLKNREKKVKVDQKAKFKANFVAKYQTLDVFDRQFSSQINTLPKIKGKQEVHHKLNKGPVSKAYQRNVMNLKRSVSNSKFITSSPWDNNRWTQLTSLPYNTKTGRPVKSTRKIKKSPKKISLIRRLQMIQRARKLTNKFSKKIHKHHKKAGLTNLEKKENLIASFYHVSVKKIQLKRNQKKQIQSVSSKPISRVQEIKNLKQNVQGSAKQPKKVEIYH